MAEVLECALCGAQVAARAPRCPECPSTEFLAPGDAEAIREAVARSERGEVADLGSFAQYADDAEPEAEPEPEPEAPAAPPRVPPRREG